MTPLSSNLNKIYENAEQFAQLGVAGGKVIGSAPWGKCFFSLLKKPQIAMFQQFQVLSISTQCPHEHWMIGMGTFIATLSVQTGSNSSILHQHNGCIGHIARYMLWMDLKGYLEQKKWDKKYTVWLRFYKVLQLVMQVRGRVSYLMMEIKTWKMKWETLERW